MASIFLTGGAGFIGSHIAEALISDNHKVFILDDLSGGFVENIPPKAEFIKGSILSYTLLKDLFSKRRFEYVFHLAAYAAEGLSHFIKRFNYKNNLLGSVNLINLSILHKIRCFVFTSSIAVYGRSRVPMTEEALPLPEDSYGIAKYAVEKELQVSYAMFGLPYIVFRPHNVYGERQNIGDKYRNVVGIFMRQLMEGQPMTIFGDGTQKRAFSYIGDVAPVIAHSIQTPMAYNEIFNIGAETPCTVNDLAKEVARVMGLKPKIEYLPPRNEVHAAYSEHSKARKILKTKARTSLHTGLTRMARWVKCQGIRKSREFSNIEIRINLPPSWQSETSYGQLAETI